MSALDTLRSLQAALPTADVNAAKLVALAIEQLGHEAERTGAQRKRLFAAGSILALLREALDDCYAGDRSDAPDLSYAVGVVMRIVDRVAAELDEMASRGREGDA